MDNSLNSSSPEPTVSHFKSIFKRPANVTEGFEVSINESVTAVPSNKSELDLDTTSSGANKELPFKKSGKSVQQDFNVSSDDSALNSEAEQSVTFAKPLPVFSKKRKSLVDFFNVSYNESNVSLQPDDTGRSVDESNIFNRNPFKKKNECHSEVLLRNEPIMQEVTGEAEDGFDESQQPETTCCLGDEADSTAFITKENPFKKGDQQVSSSQLELSAPEGNKTNEDENQTATDSRVNEELDSDILTKSNPFQHKISLQSNNSISTTKQRNNVSIVENTVFADSNNTSKNLSIDRSISKVTNKSTSYLEQSSINDENLNNWMSDQSDEEIPPPRVPSVTANLSHTKENPPVPNSPTAERNKLSDWEQKLNEIVSNAERKSKAAKTKIISPPEPKPKPFKKSDLNVEKSIQNTNQYKPPKLIKPAPFATKKLYEYIIKRLQPKYGIDTVLESENLVMSICDTVKKVTRRKTHQKRLIQNLKKEMAEAGLIETTMDFYEFVIKFLPYDFRVKVVPCVQPVTNMVFPPKDGLNPFDKIL